MAESVYISKNIDSEQLKFMNLLEESEISYFELSEIEARLQTRFENINEVLENLEHKNVLQRIERGKYAKRTFSDINALACFISKNGAIGYWSALHYHGLTERFPNTVFVKKPGRKKDTTINNIKLRFISVKSSKMIGLQTIGYGNSSFLITDKETTFLDCFDLPIYAGDFEDLLKAYAASAPDENKLIKYCEEYGSKALTKRLGFLSSFFHANTCQAFISYAESIVNNNYDLLNSNGSEKAVLNSKWKLKVNILESLLLDTKSELK